ncbi:MAG: N-acetylmuramoyl-L-alanine amidase [Coraliomargarita sp.]
MLVRFILTLSLVPLLCAGPLADRYLPEIEDEVLLQRLCAPSPSETERYWRTAEEIREQRMISGSVLPLAGLRLAIDPGHLGGEWAELEGRNFRTSEQDYWVREGELVLEVAKRIRDQLAVLGAEVMLLREDSTPANPRPPSDYLEAVVREMGPMQDGALAPMADYAIEVRRRAVHRSIVVGEIATRARLVNSELKPDALLSLHINAARWPILDGVEQFRLVDSNHLHVLIFGCMSPDELSRSGQLAQLERKLKNGSGPEELLLATALAESLATSTQLPAAQYQGNHAIRPLEDQPYVWARNLMLLRLVECPVVMLEPYVANSLDAYPRIQSALQGRADGAQPAVGDILLEYADAVVAGVLDAYGDENRPKASGF